MCDYFDTLSDMTYVRGYTAVRTPGGRMVYAVKPDGCKEAVEFIPGDGMRVWEILAHYIPGAQGCRYYRVAGTKREARKRFMDSMPYMKIQRLREITDGEELRDVLHDMYKMPIF